jgi:hypothetical protein
VPGVIINGLAFQSSAIEELTEMIAAPMLENWLVAAGTFVTTPCTKNLF